MADLRFAVFGIGYWSSLQIPAWLAIGGVNLIAMYNRTISKAENAAKKYNVDRVYDDAEELFQNESLDFVDIITQVNAHAKFVLLAAKYKVPVICQKPMSPDYQTCKEMVSACKKAGIPFFIHENFRWQPGMRAVKQALDEGHIGEPFRANIQLSNWGYAGFGFEEQPFLKTLDHFALTDMGSHLFDIARFFFGEAQSMYCQTYKTEDYIGGEDVVSALLRFGDVMCHCEICNRRTTRVYIEGKNGQIELDVNNKLTIITDESTIVRDCNELISDNSWIDPNEVERNGADLIHSIVECNAHLLNALKTDKTPETSGEDNLKTMDLMFSAIESAEHDNLIMFK